MSSSPSRPSTCVAAALTAKRSEALVPRIRPVHSGAAATASLHRAKTHPAVASTTTISRISDHVRRACGRSCRPLDDWPIGCAGVRGECKFCAIARGETDARVVLEGEQTLGVPRPSPAVPRAMCC